MKIAPIITTSITSPRTTWEFILPASYFCLFLVLQLDAEARGVQALHGLGHALDEEQRAGRRYDHLERPQNRPPRRLLGDLVDGVGVPALLPAHPEEQNQRREEE